jgi:hypothetical protein
MRIDYVIERAAANVRERLAARGVDEPAYAVAIYSPDPEALCADTITVGLERDRAAALESLSGYDAFWSVWNPEEFAYTCPFEPSLFDDPGFAAAQAEVWEPPGAAWDQLGEEPQRYVLNRVAARVGAEHPLRAMTDDFAVYAFDEDFGEYLVANIRFSASPDAVRRLEAKGLLMPGSAAGGPPA